MYCHQWPLYRIVWVKGQIPQFFSYWPQASQRLVSYMLCICTRVCVCAHVHMCVCVWGVVHALMKNTAELPMEPVNPQVSHPQKMEHPTHVENLLPEKCRGHTESRKRQGLYRFSLLYIQYIFLFLKTNHDICSYITYNEWVRGSDWSPRLSLALPPSCYVCLACDIIL